MDPPAAIPSPDSTTRDRFGTDVQTSLHAITHHTQLLHRRILRADGLTTPDRDLILGTLAAMRRDLDDIALQLDGQTRDRDPS